MSDSPTRPPWWKGERGEWYVVAQAILFVLIAVGPLLPSGVSQLPASLTVVARGLGAVLMLSGAALAVWGLGALGSRNLTALPYPKERAALVTDGPYAIVRNPIYAGLIMGAFGWAAWWRSWPTLVFAATLFVLFDFKTRVEEQWLIERFPEYAEYCTRVKKLIPWVY